MSDNIKVVVKVRPLISREIEDKLCHQWRLQNDSLFQIDQNGKDTGQIFTFDKVYGEDTKTADVYKDIAKPIVEAATAGINGTIFAYGQTSSGKTYTMSGTKDSPGIIQLAVQDLFNIMKSMEDRDFLLRVSYMEIYNDTIKDLLNINNEKIKIHESHNGVKVDVSEKVTSTIEEVFNWMKEGDVNRRTSATNMNEFSSRSHSIFQITIESRKHTEQEEEEGSVNVSQLNLVDLAGSERAGQTGATGQRFKEGTHINKSLSALALVIKQLSEDNRHTNYRDSKLTRILQNSLGGNAKTSIICAVTPAALDETISTLQFANRAKAIKNKPEVNEVATNASMIQNLTRQLRKMQTMLESKKNIEQDNKKLKQRIAELQGQIINGCVGPRVPAAARRRTWCAPASTDGAAPPPPPTRACTPALKYNPLSLPGAPEPPPRPPSARLPRVPEEPPPPHPTFGIDVIELSDDDDFAPSIKSSGGCSPHHTCYRSKTPPCILRERTNEAEKSLKSHLKLTEREKIYQPNVVELMEKLDQNTTKITNLEEKIEELNKQCEDKEALMTDLRSQIDKANDDVKSSSTEKTVLESRCSDLETKLTDMEVSYETLKRKAKTREDELLSLLEEQRILNDKRNGKLSKPQEKDLCDFMNLSKDISLVNSDNESSVLVTKDDEAQQVQNMLLTDLQNQITSKNEMIANMEAELEAFREKILQLETANGDIQAKVATLNIQVETLQADKSMLESTVETLQSTIKNQKENLDTANKDIESYNEMIIEMQTKLKDVSSQVLNSSSLELLMASGEQLVVNNESFKAMIESFKAAIIVKNEEIERLKALVKESSENSDYKNEIDNKNAQIEDLINETIRLNKEIDDQIKHIDRVTGENSNILKSKQHLALELSDAIKKFEEANKIKEETISTNKQLETKVEEISNFVAKLEESDRSNQLVSVFNSTVIRIRNAIWELTGKEEELKPYDQFNNTELSELEDVLTALGATHKEVQHELSMQKEKIQELLHVLDQYKNTEEDKQIQYKSLLKKHENLSKEFDEVTKQLADKSESFDALNKEYEKANIVLKQNRNTIETLQKKQSEMENQIDTEKVLLQKMNEEYQRLKEENQKLKTMTHDETLSSKDEEITMLEDKLLEMEIRLKNQNSEMIHEAQKADEHIKNMRQTLACILDNVINIASSHSIEHDLTVGADGDNSLDIFKQIPYVLETIVHGIKNICKVDYNSKIEILQNSLQESEKQITELQSENNQLKNEFETLNSKYEKCIEKLNAMEKDNDGLSKDLNVCNELIESLKVEMKAKRDQLENMETCTRSWKEKFINLDHSLNGNIIELQQKNSVLETKVQELASSLKKNICESINIPPVDADRTQNRTETNTPQSLISICSYNIIKVLGMQDEEYKLTPTSSDSAICQCNELTRNLQQSEVKIAILKNAVEHLQKENQKLIEEQEKTRQELKLLVEPASELEKKLATHKTHLATLTNTTYTETRLLKSQVKSLEHHHSSLHNVCQRDIQKLRKQLRDLYLILNTEHARGDMHSSSLKRYSLPIILDANVLQCNLKNESTLDGDLLMLDTNVTFASNATLTCHDQTCFDITQADTESCCAEGMIDLPVDDHKNMMKKLQYLTEENRNLRQHVTKSTELREDIRNSSFKEETVKIVITPCDEDDAACENCQEKDKLLCDLQTLTDEWSVLKAQKTDLEEKYNNLSLEVPKSESLVRKLSALEKQLSANESKIKTLKVELEDKNRQNEHLQEENDTLSTQIMENITEVDELKKAWTELKIKNTELSSKCETLEEIIKQRAPKLSDQVNHLTRRLSNSEILNRSQTDSDTSRKLYTLHHELDASKEDCKKITEVFATIKNDFERSNLSIGQNMDLDDSMGEGNLNFTKDFGSYESRGLDKIHAMPNIPEEKSLDYSLEKTDCLSYFLEKTGANKENFQHEVKIIDIMKMLYNNLEMIHANEVQNLSNKLRHFEETKNALEAQITDITSKHSLVCEELNHNRNTVESISRMTAAVRSSIENINRDITSGDDETNTKFVTQFKEDILKHIDASLSINTVDVFEALVDKIAGKHQNDLSSITEQNTKMMQNMEILATELTSVKDNVSVMEEQLQVKEDEYNILKTQKNRMHEISSAVTLDIVKKERDLFDTIKQGCNRLIEHNIIKPDEIDFNCPINNNISIIFDRLINQNQNSEVENEKQRLSIEISILQEKVTEMDSIKTEVATLKATNIQLRSEIENSLAANDNSNQVMESMKQEIHRLKSQVECNEQVIKSFEDEQSNKMDADDQLTEWIQKAKDFETENRNLKLLNEEIQKQMEDYAMELKKSGKAIENYKSDIEKMTLQSKELQNSLQSYVSLLEDMKCESNELSAKNKTLLDEIGQFAIRVQGLEIQYEDKCEDCSKLERNIKTHEKTVEIQSNMIIRLQKQKDDDSKLVAEKEARIAELLKDIETSKEAINKLQTMKDTLEIRLTELESEVKDGQSCRASRDLSGRARRRSLHDSKRMLAEDKIDEDPSKVEALLGREVCPDDELSSGRSTPARLLRRRDSLLQPEESPPARPGSAAAARRRRQSAHDAARNILTPEPRESLAGKLKDDSTHSKSGEISTDGENLRERLTACEQELEELKERYRELDEECETCAQYLRERDEQCLKLKKEKVALEKTIAEMKLSQDSNSVSSSRSGDAKRNYADAAVNTDEDWANLHAVVVDRMSFDAEVERNKQLTRAVEEFRRKNRELRAALARPRRAPPQELEELKCELESCKEQIAALKERNRELDEECDTCGEYIRERDERIRRLHEAKAALEEKVHELQKQSKDVAQSARKKRQSAHDAHRAARPARVDAATDTSEDTSSYQEQRDAQAQKIAAMTGSIDTLSSQKAELEQQLAAMTSRLAALSAQPAAMTSQLTALAAAQQQSLYVATGSAIVQNQQLTDLFKENQKLKKLNSKLVNICKKRGKQHGDRDNES